MDMESARKESRVMAEMAAAPMMADHFGGAPPPPPPSPPPAEPVASTPSRLVHHDGWMRLASPDPKGLLSDVAALGTSLGGRVEHHDDVRVSLKVPVDRFDEAWDAVFEMGEAVDHWRGTVDLTEATQATDLYLRLHEKTLARLQALLGKSTDALEKMALLAEIQRVTEAADTLSAQLRTLRDLAALSSLSVEAVDPGGVVTAPDVPLPEGMNFLDGLSPFRRDPGDGPRIEVRPVDGLVALSPRGPYRVESALGTSLWTRSERRRLDGDGAFWADTMADRLESRYGDAVRFEAGRWSCVEWGSAEGWSWWACAAVQSARVELAQVHFPDAGERARFHEPIRAALSEAP